MNRPANPPHNRRVSLISRIAAITVGAYVVVWLITATISLALPGPPADAARTAMMASFFIWAVVVMAVFHARSATRAWAWLLGTIIPLGLVVWFLLPGTHL